MASQAPQAPAGSTESTQTKEPIPQTSQEKILEPEFKALTQCLKDVMIRTGQIYKFYADTRKLGIQRHVPNPPRSLTSALGRDIEKYDQLCDSIEAHLLRAISVLKRDLRREEERVAIEERRKNAEASMLPPPIPLPVSETAVETSSTHAPSEGSATNPRNSPVLHPISGRRPSAISISSLHRPQFPLKLDLSATSLRITEEEAAAILKGGLPSPVTLAPKSARPGANDYPPDFMAAFAHPSLALDGTSGPPEIDLTLPDGMTGIGIGDSSDKPIELDLDSMDIDMANMTNAFANSVESGESNHTHIGLFSAVLIDAEGEQLQSSDGNRPIKEEGDILSDFNLDSATTDDLFGDFPSTGDLGMDLVAASTSISHSQTAVAPSPDSLIAQLSAVSGPPSHDAAENFDMNSIDLSSLTSDFFSHNQVPEMSFPMGMGMDAFMNSGNVLNMESSGEEKGDAGGN